MSSGLAAAPALTSASSVLCPHGGAVDKTGTAKLKVAASAVLTKADLSGKKIIGCSVADNLQTSTLQCKFVQAISSGESSKLKVKRGAAAIPVLLDTLTGLTTGTPPPPPAGPPLKATANQSKLKAAP
jgi:hypothetical protein